MILRFRQTLDRMIADDSAELERSRRAAMTNLQQDRAVRVIVLLARIDALTDVVGRLVRRDKGIRKDGTAFVVIAGPNPPEVLTATELAEVFQEFETTEVGVWQRTGAGDLEELGMSTSKGPVDDAFEYWATELTADGSHVATVSWSRKRVGS